MNEPRRFKLLVVDDDPFNVRLLESQLMQKYDIVTAFSGAEAFEVIHTEAPDLVLLDVMMPDMDGYEVCRKIKSSEKTSLIPVILITALSSKSDMIEGIDAGADDFLTKPVDRVEVSLRVRNLLRNKQLHDDLMVEGERAKTYLEIAGTIIVVVDQNHKVVLANAQCCDTLGYSENELLGSNWFDLAIPPEERSMVLSIFNKILSVDNEQMKIFENNVIKKDGTQRRILWNNSPLEDSSTNLLQVISSGVDITEKKIAEDSIKKYAAELSNANESLKVLDQMKDEFISNLSHELKTPLISIKGYSELVHDEVLGTLNEKQKSAMRIVLEKYDNLSFLLDSLIYLSIVKSGKVKYRFDPIQVEDSLRRVCEYFSFKAGDRGISVRREVGDDLPLVMGDVEYIPFIFRSLIDNAIKFSPDGGNISILIFEDDGHVHISIKDEGIGIPDDELSHVFERFYQIDGSMARKYGGTGLGLYVSKNIVEIHNGIIWVESEEGKGSTVHVKFPGCGSELSKDNQSLN